MSTNEPPGSLGFKSRIAHEGIGDDFFQAVRIIVPPGARVNPVHSSESVDRAPNSTFGLNVGRPYRFVVSNIPLLQDLPLYPSIELIDRTYPPRGMEVRFAIPIELSAEDLRAAAHGSYIERVVYIEDPDLALPIATKRDSAQRVFDVAESEDPLAVASTLGRPVAVVRLGSIAPGPHGPDDRFSFGSPPVQHLEPHRRQRAVENPPVAERPNVPGKSESPVFENPRLRRILR